MIFVLMLLNSLLGLVLFEWSWLKSARVRKVVASRDGLFPAWRRNDVSHWSKLKMYPSALTIMPVRIVLFMFLLVATYVGTRIIFWKTDINSSIPVNIKQRQEKLFGIMARIMLSLVFFVQLRYECKKEGEELDYSYYLGTEDSAAQDCRKKVPTVLMNHTTGVDALVAVALLNGKVCFLVGDHIRHVPFINYLVTVSGGLFAPRGGTMAAREATV